jgi:NADP-dependent 3-hydroxy acid dehydrogenase YdfG
MTDLMRQEIGDRNIRVCALMPGATSTEVGNHVTDPTWRAAIQARISREGAVLPSEVAETIVFILSLPRHVNISEICVRPTTDTTP